MHSKTIEHILLTLEDVRAGAVSIEEAQEWISETLLDQGGDHPSSIWYLELAESGRFEELERLLLKEIEVI